jgi:cell division protein FtsZ
MTTEIIDFVIPKNKSSIIKVLGVGGGGSNAVNHMYKQGIEGVDFVVCNTDSQALDLSPVPNKVQLGINLTEGRGAGNLPEIGRKSALEDGERIKELLGNNTKMLFITAGMGGGTGTGAAPVIASISKELGILTVGIVTIPFHFEGRKRRQQADDGINQLKEHVDTLLIISNDRLRELYGNLGVSDAFGKADDVLSTAAKGIAEIITKPGNINVDFADVKTVMSNSGVAIMGSGNAEGEDRASKAVGEALASPLLNDNNIRGAENILLNITYGTEEILMDEITEITDLIIQESGGTAEVIWGHAKDESLGKKINVTLVATGFPMGKGPANEEKPIIKVGEIGGERKSQEIANEKDPKIESHDDFKVFQRPPAIPTEIKCSFPNNENAATFEFDLKNIPSSTANDKQRVSRGGFSLKPETKIGEDQVITEEDLQRKIKEREERLRDLSIKVRTPDGLQFLENQPAFVRRNVSLSQVPASSESQVSRYSLSDDPENKTQIKSNNSFLHDNVD